MSLASSFLFLSMKEQICITIIALTLFCIGVILIVCCSLIYEILNKDYKQKKLYFYNRYKEYIESSFYFQSFYLMQYEEIIHRMKKQIWRTQQSITIYPKNAPLLPLESYSEYVKNMGNTTDYNFTDLDLKNQKDYPYFYIISFSESESKQVFLIGFSLNYYQLFSNSIITHDIYDNFRIPGYGVPIIEENPLFFNLNYSTLFSFNHTKISEKMKEFSLEKMKHENSKESYESIFNKTLDKAINSFINRTESFMMSIRNNLETFKQMFDKFYKEMIQYSEEIFTNEEVMHEHNDLLAGYTSRINYENDTISLMSTDTDIFKNFYYSEMKAIHNLLFFLINKIVLSLDIDFIPIYSENNTILSQELCSIFKSKQKVLSGNDFNYEDVYSDIHKLESNLENCLIDNELINNQEEIKEIFDLSFEHFIENTSFIFQGLLHLIPENKDFSFYFMKYSYPNYNTLKEFQSEYLFSNQINFYSFASFNIVQKYVEHVHQVTTNVFFFIIIIIVYSWVICLFINLMIFFKVIKDWTEPIKKLQEAVESNDIKDESIFKYEYDDIINEFFVTCKELLTGQIENNDNVFKSSNNLGKENDKKIDKHMYKKNIIINNDLMGELVAQQQNMLDFSKNIKLNTPNNINSNSKSINKSNKKKEELNNNNDKLLKSNGATKKEKEKEINEENEPYIKLFKIAEYLSYYRSKLDSNKVMFINSDMDESKMSKLMSGNAKSINSSISNQIKNRNDETNENYYINMLDETNISYLWYMETKKKYNNFNYNLSSDYRELFTEFNDSYKNVSSNEQKRSINLHKKDKNAGV